MIYKSDEIPWWTVHVGKISKQGLLSSIRSNFPNEGPITHEAEEFFKNFFNVRHAVLTTSGTAAIFLALKSLGIDKSSRVAVPNLTFIATANAAHLTGAEVTLIEVNEDRFTLDLGDLKREHGVKRIDAIVPVHISGKAAITEEMKNWASKEGIKIIEDAAEAFGSKDPVSGQYLGTIGHAGAFSFSPNKVITSGQGGLVVTNDDAVALAVRTFKDQGRPTRGTGGDDQHMSVGFNFKFTDFQASLLRGQFSQIEKRIEHLTNVYCHYKYQLEESSDFLLSRFMVEKGEVPLWPELYSEKRKSIESRLTQESIGYRRFWHPISTQTPYLVEKSFPISTSVSRNGMWLPSSFGLKTKHILRITQAIMESLK